MTALIPCTIVAALTILASCNVGNSRDDETADSVAAIVQRPILRRPDTAVAEETIRDDPRCVLDTLPTGVLVRLGSFDTVTVNLSSVQTVSQLKIRNPAGESFFVVYGPRPSALEANPTEADLYAAKEVTLRVADLLGTRLAYGAPEAERVFQDAGIYNLVWGENLESDGGFPMDSTEVLYCPGG